MPPPVRPPRPAAAATPPAHAPNSRPAEAGPGGQRGLGAKHLRRVILLLQPTLAHDQWLGAVFGLGSGIISSIAYLNVRRLGELGEPEWRTVFYFSALSALGGLPWLLAASPFHAIDLRGWLLLLGVGGFGVLAQLCMTAAYKRGKTLVSASLAYSTVVFSSVFGMLLWDETLPWTGWLGVILIIASGLLATALSGRADTAAVTD